eukprot:m.1039704 g.1039704  ORF g.1039704 m.1039704 type:complete len:313 (+) comp24150_c2_seq1:214-1152(+)
MSEPVAVKKPAGRGRRSLPAPGGGRALPQPGQKRRQPSIPGQGTNNHTVLPVEEASNAPEKASNGVPQTVGPATPQAAQTSAADHTEEAEPVAPLPCTSPSEQEHVVPNAVCGFCMHDAVYRTPGGRCTMKAPDLFLSQRGPHACHSRVESVHGPRTYYGNGDVFNRHGRVEWSGKRGRFHCNEIDPRTLLVWMNATCHCGHSPCVKPGCRVCDRATMHDAQIAQLYMWGNDAWCNHVWGIYFVAKSLTITFCTEESCIVQTCVSHRLRSFEHNWMCPGPQSCHRKSGSLNWKSERQRRGKQTEMHRPRSIC